MKLSIRMKIFLPVMLILITFPLAVWCVFRYSLDGHMNYNARRDLERMVRKTGEILSQEKTGNEDKEDENALLGKLRDALQTETGEARMMLLGDRYRVIFPKNYDNQPEMVQIYSTFLTNATLDDMSWERGKIGEETIEIGRASCRERVSWYV